MVIRKGISNKARRINNFVSFKNQKRRVKPLLTKKVPKLIRMLSSDELAPLIKGCDKVLEKFGENLQFRL